MPCVDFIQLLLDVPSRAAPLSRNLPTVDQAQRYLVSNVAAKLFAFCARLTDHNCRLGASVIAVKCAPIYESALEKSEQK